MFSEGSRNVHLLCWPLIAVGFVSGKHLFDKSKDACEKMQNQEKSVPQQTGNYLICF